MQIWHAWSKLTLDNDIIVYKEDADKQEHLVISSSIKHDLERFVQSVWSSRFPKTPWSCTKQVLVASPAERHPRFLSCMSRGEFKDTYPHDSSVHSDH